MNVLLIFTIQKIPKL